MLTVGDRIPKFDLQAVVSLGQDTAFTRFTDQAHRCDWQRSDQFLKAA